MIHPDFLPELLLEITTVLLWPVIGVLLVALAATGVYMGGLVSEWVARCRRCGVIRKLVDSLKTNPEKRIYPTDIPHFPGPIAQARAELSASAHLARNKVIDDVQLHADHKLIPLELASRLGPMFGLAGTLIPLGPALRSLSSGNVQQLASNLVVAFGTTVLGLIIGGTCFAIKAIRKNWYDRDINNLEFITEHLKNNEKS